MKNVLKVMLLGALLAPAIHADSFGTWLDRPLEGKPTPVWSDSTAALVLRFTDMQTNVVRMTMTATSLAAPQAIKTWWFNLVGIAPSAVTFTKVSGSTIDSIRRGIDCCKADGTGGNFDFELGFSTKQGQRFLGGTTTVYDLRATGLTAMAFNSKSVPQNYYRSVAHIISLPNGDSTYVGGVPEPASWLLFSAVAGVLAFGIRRRRTA